MKISIKKEIIPIIILILSVVISIYFYKNFPERVATHWNFSGQVDGYSGRAFGAFMFPVMLIFIYFLLLIAPSLDPKKERYAEFEKVYRIFRVAFLIIMFGIFLATGLYNLNYKINIGVVIPIFVGALMMLIGNYMGKIKKNYFFGIRTPWTLSSETVWNKTHRVGGYAFILFGILIMVSPLLNETLGTVAFIVGILIMTVGTFGCSYIFYRQENIKEIGKRE